MKNYLKYSLGLIVFVMIALIAMHWLPAITIDGHTMRRVDLLSDVRPSKSDMEELDTDSLPPVPAVKPIFVDTCRTGMTCIEDYSDSTLRGMTPFIVRWMRSLQKGVWYVSLSSAILLLKPIYLLRICGRCCKSVLEAVE